MLEVLPLLPEIYQTYPLVVCTHHCCLPSILDKDIAERKLLKVQTLIFIFPSSEFPFIFLLLQVPYSTHQL